MSSSTALIFVAGLGAWFAASNFRQIISKTLEALFTDYVERPSPAKHPLAGKHTPEAKLSGSSYLNTLAKTAVISGTKHILAQAFLFCLIFGLGTGSFHGILTGAAFIAGGFYVPLLVLITQRCRQVNARQGSFLVCRTPDGSYAIAQDDGRQ